MVRNEIFLKVALDPPKQPLLYAAARCMQQLAPLGCPSPPKSWMQPRIVLLDTGKSQSLVALIRTGPTMCAQLLIGCVLLPF